MTEVSPFTNGQLSHTLQNLSVGERSWFWFCSATDAVETPLVLSPLRRDPMMHTLRAQVELIHRPAQSEAYTGLASINADGTIALGAPGVSTDALSALASWVLRNVRAFPDLERLRDACFVRIDGDRVVAQYDDPELWLGMDAGPQPGSIDEAAARLAAAPPLVPYWVWMTDCGPGNAPFMLLASTTDDPGGEAFASQISSVRLRSPALGKTFSGTLHQSSDGLPVLTTPSSTAEQAPAILDALTVAHPGLSALQQARVFRIKGQRRQEIKRGPDLTRELAALQALSGPGHQIQFFFTNGGDGHPAALLLANEPAALKAAARALVTGPNHESTRGRVVCSKAGWLEFRARGEFANFIGLLAEWTAQHIMRHPGLGRLRGARMTLRDKEDNILSRHKDDKAWAIVP